MSPTAIDPDPDAKDDNGIDIRSAPLDSTNISLAHSPGKSTEAFGGKDAFGAGHPSPDMPKQGNPFSERIPPSPSAVAKKSHPDTVTTEMAGTTKSAGTNPAGVPWQGNLSPQRHQSAPTAPVQTAPPTKIRTDTDPESLQQNQTASGAAKYTESNAAAAPWLSDVGQQRNVSTLLTPAQAMPHNNTETNLTSTPGSDNHAATNARAKVSTSDLPSLSLLLSSV